MIFRYMTQLMQTKTIMRKNNKRTDIVKSLTKWIENIDRKTVITENELAALNMKYGIWQIHVLQMIEVINALRKWTEMKRILTFWICINRLTSADYNRQMLAYAGRRSGQFVLGEENWILPALQTRTHAVQ